LDAVTPISSAVFPPQVFPENVAMNNKSVSRSDLSHAAHIVVGDGVKDSKERLSKGGDAYASTFRSMPVKWEPSLRSIPEFANNDGTYELALKMNAMDILFYDYVREKFGEKIAGTTTTALRTRSRYY
jgi:hypothetical protein